MFFFWPIFLLAFCGCDNNRCHRGRDCDDPCRRRCHNDRDDDPCRDRDDRDPCRCREDRDPCIRRRCC